MMFEVIQWYKDKKGKIQSRQLEDIDIDEINIEDKIIYLN